MAQLFAISGVVINQDQEPLSFVSVSITDSPKPLPDLSALTNEQGEFSFQNLMPGPYTVQFNYNTIQVERRIQVKDQDVHFRQVIQMD